MYGKQDFLVVSKRKLSKTKGKAKGCQFGFDGSKTLLGRTIFSSWSGSVLSDAFTSCTNVLLSKDIIRTTLI